MESITNGEQFLKAVEAADITQDDWTWDIMEAIADDYTKGYITKCIEELGNCLMTDSPDYLFEFKRLSEVF